MSLSECDTGEPAAQDRAGPEDVRPWMGRTHEVYVPCSRRQLTPCAPFLGLSFCEIVTFLTPQGPWSPSESCCL